MPLAFSASQALQLSVEQHADQLPDYLNDEERVIGALLDPKQLENLSDEAVVARWVCCDTRRATGEGQPGRAEPSGPAPGP